MTEYVPGGSEFTVNTTSLGNQYGAVVAELPGGGFVAIFQTDNPTFDGSDTAIVGQIFDANGVKVGGEFVVNELGMGIQQVPSVTVLSNGTIAVAWTTNAVNADTNVVARLFDPTGTALGGEFVVSTTTASSQFTPIITALSGGGFAVSWDDWSSWQQKARVFDNTGTALGNEFSTNTGSTSFNGLYGDTVALAGGGFVTIWRVEANSTNYRGQIFDAQGNAVGSAFTLSGTVSAPSLAALSDGSFVVAWDRQVSFNSSNYTIHAQHFSATGTALGGEIVVNQTSTLYHGSPEVTETADGGFLVAWSTGTTSQDGSGWAVMARSFDASGLATSDEFVVNNHTAGNQNLRELITMDDGRILATWASGDWYTPGADGNGYSSQAMFLSPYSATNTAPTIVSGGGGASAAVTINEHTKFATMVVASDAGGPEATTFSISGGADAARFAINAATGRLTFINAPDFETPGDADGDNVYEVVVTASDGSLSDSQTLLVSVADVTEAIVFTSPLALTVGENSTEFGQLSATGNTGAPITFTIIGGADANLFFVSSNQTAYGVSGDIFGQLIPDFENPGDADGDNVYEFEVLASDGTYSTVQTVTITISDVYEPVTFLSPSALTMAEGMLTVATIETTSTSPYPITYMIGGGDDAGLFGINETTGALYFLSAPDYESPQDFLWDNVYNVIVVAQAGPDGFSLQNVNVTVTDNSNELWFDIDQTVGLYEGAANVADFGTSGYTLSIVGGANAGAFVIDSAGVLQFNLQPAMPGAPSPLVDFENPADADGDNVYQVVVEASDGYSTAIREMWITIGDGFDFTSPAEMYIEENASLAGFVWAELTNYQASWDQPSYSIAAGFDGSAFTIDAATGELSFAAAPDFENPTDSDGDNVYQVLVSIAAYGYDYSSGNYQMVYTVEQQLVTVNVYDAFDDLTIATPAPVLYAQENQTAATTLLAYVGPNPVTDGSVAFAIVGGADAALFTIDAVTGAVSFAGAPDREAPADADGDNVYDLVVGASRGSASTSLNLAITVTDENEAPVFTSAASFAALENATAVGSVAAADPEMEPTSYAIVGGADAASFVIDAATGALSFMAAPDHETPGDADGDNVYEVTVQASDGSLTTIQAVTVTLGNVNEAPVITSQPLFSVNENATAVGMVTSSDPEGTARTYGISGGADAARFAIDAATGALSFVTAPNFEAPSDSNGDNVYQVTITASDGSLSASQTLSISVGNVNEAPVISSGGGAASAAVSINENTTAITTVTAGDPDGATLTYSIVGGADAARFTINGTTGALSFTAAPNWEAPTDSNGDNVYNVVVQASDGTLIDTQSLAVTVANVVDGITLTGTSKANTLTGTVAEDTISGLGGNDTLNGGAGADTINGGDGTDQIIGGAGADTLTGGLGADTFVFQALSDSSAAMSDFLTDFSTGQNDKISLSAIDANTSLSGDQAFSWIGTGAFTGVAGQLRYYQSGGDTFVTGDVNGDGLGDFSIRIDPLVTLAATNLVL